MFCKYVALTPKNFLFPPTRCTNSGRSGACYVDHDFWPESVNTIPVFVCALKLKCECPKFFCFCNTNQTCYVKTHKVHQGIWESAAFHATQTKTTVFLLKNKCKVTIERWRETKKKKYISSSQGHVHACTSWHGWQYPCRMEGPAGSDHSGVLSRKKVIFFSPAGCSRTCMVEIKCPLINVPKMSSQMDRKMKGGQVALFSVDSAWLCMAMHACISTESKSNAPSMSHFLFFFSCLCASILFSMVMMWVYSRRRIFFFMMCA